MALAKRISLLILLSALALLGPTRGAWSEVDIPRGPLRLQGDHGAVAYRNVRLRAL